MKFAAASVSLLAATTTSFLPQKASAAGAFQSGPNVGALYAGGLTTDPVTSELFATGLTYDDNGSVPTPQSSCFLAKFDPSQLENDALQASRIGSGQIVEACHALAVVNADQDFVIAGNSDPGGMYGYPEVATGFAMAIKQDQFTVVTGQALESSQVSYPINVVADPLTQSVYVSTLTSNSLSLNPSYDSIVQQYSQPNWLQYKKYGSAYEMTIEKVTFDGSNMQTAWSSHFPIETDINGQTPDVYLAGMILKELPSSGQKLLIAAGSTRGEGEGYGTGAGDDEDGFLTALDPSTGRLISSGKSNHRIGTAQDDIIAGICNDPNDEESFYVVGASKGDMEDPGSTVSTASRGLEAYVRKNRVSDLGEHWTVQWGATKSTGGTATAVAMECLVNRNGDVYVAGVVQDGASMEGALGSKGGDDIFVALLNGDDGTVKWMVQLGSAGNEHLARGGGLAFDPSEDLVVFGDTDGNFYRARGSDETSSDVFLVTLNQADGSYPATGSSMNAVPSPTPPSAVTPTESFGGGSGAGDMKSGTGIQSGPSASGLYPGGMVYDPAEDTVYLTGITYDTSFEGGSPSNEASCFIASVSLSEGRVNDWGNKAVYGSQSYLETCNSVALHRFSELVAVGSADQGSTFLSSTSFGIGRMAGMALAVNRNNFALIDSTAMVTIDPTNRFQYPVSVVSDGDDLYIVSLTSTDNQFSDAYNEIDPVGATSARSPNWINIQKYGTSFDMTVTKLTLQENEIDGLPEGSIQFTTVWSKEFPIDADDNGTKPRVYIGGAIIKKNPGVLAIAGSTRGMGNGYGNARGTDEDGFVTLLDLSTGNLAQNVERNNIREGSAQDDIVNGICHDPNDSSSFYIVGATFGSVGQQLSSLDLVDGSLQAFVRKMSANSLGEQWTVQLGALKSVPNDPSMAYALGCAVYGGVIYVGGVVDDNAGIVVGSEARQTNGGDDIWVGQFSTSDGSLKWLHQVGSSGNDHMAPRGGLVASAAGHAIVYGETDGSAFRQRGEGGEPDLIVMTFDSSGASFPDMDMNVPQPTPAPFAPIPAPIPNIPQQPTAVTPQPVAFGPSNVATPPTDFYTTSPKNLPPGATAAIVIVILIFAAIFAWWCCCRKKVGKRTKSLEDHVRTMEMAERQDLKKDGIFSTINGNGYGDDPLGSPNLQEGGYSDLHNKGKEVI